MAPAEASSFLQQKVLTDQMTHCAFCHTGAVFKPEGLEGFQLLPCFHPICPKCVLSWPESETSKICPECHESIQRNFVQHRLLGDLAPSDEKTLGVCGLHEGQSLKYWCLGCEQFVCDTCVRAHKGLKSTSIHVIKDKSEVSFFKPSIMCTKHPEQRVVLHCTPCGVFTCRDCQLIHHSGHNHTLASDIAEISKTVLGKEYIALNTKLFDMKAKCESYQIRKKSLENIRNVRRKDLNKIESRVIEDVRRTFKNYGKKIDKDCSALNEKIDAILRDFEVKIAPCQQATSFLWALLAKGNPEDVLYYSDIVAQRLKHLPNAPEEAEKSSANGLFEGIDIDDLESSLKRRFVRSLKKNSSRGKDQDKGKKVDVNNNKTGINRNQKKEKRKNETINRNKDGARKKDSASKKKDENKKKDEANKMLHPEACPLKQEYPSYQEKQERASTSINDKSKDNKGAESFTAHPSLTSDTKRAHNATITYSSASVPRDKLGDTRPKSTTAAKLAMKENLPNLGILEHCTITRIPPRPVKKRCSTSTTTKERVVFSPVRPSIMAQLTKNNSVSRKRSSPSSEGSDAPSRKMDRIPEPLRTVTGNAD